MADFLCCMWHAISFLHHTASHYRSRMRSGISVSTIIQQWEQLAILNSVPTDVEQLGFVKSSLRRSFSTYQLFGNQPFEFREIDKVVFAGEKIMNSKVEVHRQLQ